jgi:TonB family protein
MKTSSTGSGDRRLHARRDLAALTYVTIGDGNGGIVSNVSETGMALTAAEPIVGKILPRLVFEIPGVNRTVEVQAQVIWITESKKAAGVHFIAVPEEVRAQIANWAVPSGPNVKVSAKLPAVNVADKFPAPAFLPPPQVTPPPSVPKFVTRQSVSRSEPSLREVQTETNVDDFDKMFPSENEPSTWRATPEGAAEDREDAKRAQEAQHIAPGFDREGKDFPFTPQATPAPSRAEPTLISLLGYEQSQQYASDHELILEQPALRASAQRLTPLPAVFQPAIDQSFSRMLESQATPFLTQPAANKMWPIAGLVSFAVAICFVLGFAIQPGFLHKLPGLRDARERLFGSKSSSAITENKQVNTAELSNVAAPAANPPASEQFAATSRPPAPSVPLVTGSSALNVKPNQRVPDSTARARESDEEATPAPRSDRSGNLQPSEGRLYAPKSELSTSNQFASAQPGGQIAEGQPVNHSETNPATNSSTPVAPATSSGATAATPASSSAPVGVTTSKAPAIGASTPSVAPLLSNNVTPRATPSLGTSAQAASAMALSSSQPAAAPTAAASPSVAAAPPVAAPSSSTVPPVRSGLSSSRPAPPPSFFPVVAPGAGNVPRLMQLPEEKVIDTALVKIHSHQYVFVPAEPGPESSHAPEKLQIGERISKVAPSYPSDAQQKGMGGTVQLRATIARDGTVENVKALHGPALFLPAAMDAVRQWRYRPTLLNHEPIDLQEDFTIEFRPLGTQYRE